MLVDCTQKNNNTQVELHLHFLCDLVYGEIYFIL